MAATGRLLSIVLDCGLSTAGGFLGARSIHAPLRFETKVPVRRLVAKRPEDGICVENDVAKTPEIEHPCNPVWAPEIIDQSGAITPKMGAALMPEIDTGLQMLKLIRYAAEFVVVQRLAFGALRRDVTGQVFPRFSSRFSTPW